MEQLLGLTLMVNRTKLDVTGTASTSQFRIVRTANEPGNNDASAINSNVIVQISPSASISN